MEKEFEKSVPVRSKKAELRLFEKYFPEDGLGHRPFSLTINKKNPAEVYALLRNLENLPSFFEHLGRVQINGPNQADWYFNEAGIDQPVRVPMQLEDDEGAFTLIWKTETSAGFDYQVGIFLENASASRGTMVRMLVAYDNLAGEVGGKIERLFGKDAMMTSKKNLYRLKAFIETGHVPTTQGQPSGRDEDESDNWIH
ncbi:SRPBCC family protein [Bdellovibrio bacteriovorus]|uniref:Cyclase/dehydrase n=1 Tax=Bdellovibrio bacteriovorus str. Tiberius TaxID=1069642 RepID=K7YZ23_BDEBC|nr:cyclase/dehydrase [Bdellovibrio bacteriovorus]AFY01930.1 cyclase/dehydrase [Bdellovibrio bacteriovorus str. Tiberius]